MTIQYEHRTNPDNPCLVEVRRKPSTGRPRPSWRHYWQCDTPQAAERYLWMLQRGEPAAAVRP